MTATAVDVRAARERARKAAWRRAHREEHNSQKRRKRAEIRAGIVPEPQADRDRDPTPEEIWGPEISPGKHAGNGLAMLARQQTRVRHLTVDGVTGRCEHYREPRTFKDPRRLMG